MLNNDSECCGCGINVRQRQTNAAFHQRNDKRNVKSDVQRCGTLTMDRSHTCELPHSCLQMHLRARFARYFIFSCIFFVFVQICSFFLSIFFFRATLLPAQQVTSHHVRGVLSCSVTVNFTPISFRFCTKHIDVTHTNTTFQTFCLCFRFFTKNIASLVVRRLQFARHGCCGACKAL